MDPMMMNDEDLSRFSDWCAQQDQRTEDPEGETYVDLDLHFGGDR